MKYFTRVRETERQRQSKTVSGGRPWKSRSMLTQKYIYPSDTRSYQWHKAQEVILGTYFYARLYS